MIERSVVEKNGDRREKSCRKVMHIKKDTTCGVFSLSKKVTARWPFSRLKPQHAVKCIWGDSYVS